MAKIINNNPWLEAFPKINNSDESRNISQKSKITKLPPNFPKERKPYISSQIKPDTDPLISSCCRKVECRLKLNNIRKHNLLCWVQYRILDGNFPRDTWYAIGTVNLHRARTGNTFLGFNDAREKPLSKLAKSAGNCNEDY